MDDYRTADLSTRELALVAYAEKVTATPAAMTRDDVARLREHGYGDRQILEATHIIGYFNHINRLADALGVELEPEMAPRVGVDEDPTAVAQQTADDIESSDEPAL